MAGELHGEVASEAIWQFNDDGLCAIRCQPLQHLPKPGTRIDTISTANGLVVVLTDDGEACTFGECYDGSPLSFVAVLVGTYIGRA